VDRFKHLVASVDSCDDFIGIGGAFEWFWVIVIFSFSVVLHLIRQQQQQRPTFSPTFENH